MGKWSDEGSSILVPTLQKDSGFEENIKNRIKCGWMKCHIFTVTKGFQFRSKLIFIGKRNAEYSRDENVKVD